MITVAVFTTVFLVSQLVFAGQRSLSMTLDPGNSLPSESKSSSSETMFGEQCENSTQIDGTSVMRCWLVTK
jgi:hypothetical protein